jgi:hypothetical protein
VSDSICKERLLNTRAWAAARPDMSGSEVIIGAIDELLTLRGSLALEDVVRERFRQISAEGWTPEHDDEHTGGELATAAACYAAPHFPGGMEGRPPFRWPYDAEWWKPKSRRRDLVRAAALIVAEIERLDRMAAP